MVSFVHPNHFLCCRWWIMKRGTHSIKIERNVSEQRNQEIMLNFVPSLHYITKLVFHGLFSFSSSFFHYKTKQMKETKKRMKHAFPFFTPHNTTHYQNLDFKWMKEEKEQSEQQCVLPSQSITIVVPFVLLVVFHSHSYIFVSLLFTFQSL